MEEKILLIVIIAFKNKWIEINIQDISYLKKQLNQEVHYKEFIFVKCLFETTVISFLSFPFVFYLQGKKIETSHLFNLFHVIIFSFTVEVIVSWAKVDFWYVCYNGLFLELHNSALLLWQLIYQCNTLCIHGLILHLIPSETAVSLLLYHNPQCMPTRQFFHYSTFSTPDIITVIVKTWQCTEATFTNFSLTTENTLHTDKKNAMWLSLGIEQKQDPGAW